MNSTSSVSLSEGEVGREDAARRRTEVPAEVEGRPESTGRSDMVRRRIGRLVTVLALAAYFVGVADLLRGLGVRCLAWVPSLCRLLGGGR
jgi:hypothetical protein